MMKIDFILSDTTKSSTTLALKNVIENSENNWRENYIVLVPETKSIIIEKELLNLSNRKAFLNVYVYSFVRLLDRFEAIQKEKLLSKQSCVILIRKIILDNIEKLECYKKSAKMVGFAEKIYETIAQFKSCDITPDELKLSLNTTQESLKAKLRDIIFLYEEYEKVLENKYYDDCDKLALISQFAKSNKFIKDCHIFVVGFDNITIEMEKVLRDIAINCKDITFSAVYFDNKREDKYIQKNELYNRFKHIADSLKYPYNPLIFKSNKKSDIKILQYNLFSSKKKKFISKGNVKIFEAKSQKQEIDFVANTILNEVERGRRFKEIGVISTNLSESLELIEECFNMYDIPYFVNIPRKISDHFLIRFIELSFEIIANRYQKERVLEFILSPFFDTKNYPLFDNFVKEAGINYYEFISEKIFEELNFYKENKIDKIFDEDKKRKIEENILKISEIIVKFQDFYNNFNKLIKNTNKIEEYINAINYIIKYFNIEAVLLNISNFQCNSGQLVQSQISSIILEKVKGFNLQLSNFLCDTEMTISEFLQIYKTGFETATVNLSPLSIDCVVIQENTDGFYNIKDMFLMGAVEGNLPSKIADTGIILDSEIDETKILINKSIEPKIEEINYREKFRAYEMIIEPSEKLFISYSSKSLTGKVNKIARIVQNVIDLFGEEIIVDKYEKYKYPTRKILERRFVNKINQFQNNHADLNGKYGVNYYYSQLGELKDNLKTYINEKFYGREFIIENTDKLYFYDDTTSVSQIQTYFDCPYKFFANYGVKLKENKDAKISIPDVGTIIHRVAEIFAGNIKKYFSMNESELKDGVSEILKIALKENYINKNKNKALINLLDDECFRLCKYILYEQNNSNFKIDKIEYKFSDGNSIKIAISDNKTIKIAGKIDRIDKFNNYLRVIDYKTGSISDNYLKKIYYGNKIQLAIYLKAIQQLTGKKVAAILYFPIHNQYDDKIENSDSYRMSGFILDDIDVIKNMDLTLSDVNKRSSIVPITIKFDKKTNEVSFSGLKNSKNRYSEFEFDAICKYVEELCKNSISEILSGYIEPSPVSNSDSEEPTSCKYCPLYGFCGLEFSKNKYGRSLDKDVSILSFYENVGDNNE